MPMGPALSLSQVVERKASFLESKRDACCRDGMSVNCVTPSGTPLTSNEHLGDTAIVADWLEPSRIEPGPVERSPKGLA